MTTFEAPDVDTTKLEAFLASDEPIEHWKDAIELLCILKAVVCHSGVTDFPSSSSDCFCPDRMAQKERDYGVGWEKDYWRNSGDEIRFIITATKVALDARAGDSNRAVTQ